jgi:hypothetical protein
MDDEARWIQVREAMTFEHDDLEVLRRAISVSLRLAAVIQMSSEDETRLIRILGEIEKEIKDEDD